MNLKERAKKLKSDIPAVFIALKDRDTPIGAKIVAWITVGYALSPIDLVPDFIPILGYLDDIILLPALVALTIKLIPNEVWERSKKTSADMWKAKEMVLFDTDYRNLGTINLAGHKSYLAVKHKIMPANISSFS